MLACPRMVSQDQHSLILRQNISNVNVPLDSTSYKTFNDHKVLLETYVVTNTGWVHDTQHKVCNNQYNNILQLC